MYIYWTVSNGNIIGKQFLLGITDDPNKTLTAREPRLVNYVKEFKCGFARVTF